MSSLPVFSGVRVVLSLVLCLVFCRSLFVLLSFLLAIVLSGTSFYSTGHRKTNIIHTKRRHRCSGLNADLYRVNLKNDPRCVCGHLFEDANHFFS